MRKRERDHVSMLPITTGDSCLSSLPYYIITSIGHGFDENDASCQASSTAPAVQLAACEMHHHIAYPGPSTGINFKSRSRPGCCSQHARHHSDSINEHVFFFFFKSSSTSVLHNPDGNEQVAACLLQYSIWWYTARGTHQTCFWKYRGASLLSTHSYCLLLTELTSIWQPQIRMNLSNSGPETRSAGELSACKASHCEC